MNYSGVANREHSSVICLLPGLSRASRGTLYNMASRMLPQVPSDTLEFSNSWLWVSTDRYFLLSK